MKKKVTSRQLSPLEKCIAAYYPVEREVSGFVHSPNEQFSEFVLLNRFNINTASQLGLQLVWAN